MEVTGNFDIDGSGDITVDSTGTFGVSANALSMALTDSSDITLTASEDNENLTIRVAGTGGDHDTQLTLRADGTGSQALHLYADNGGTRIYTPELLIENLTDEKPLVNIKSTTNSNKGSELRFTSDKGAAGADGDYMGGISFYGDNDAEEQIKFASIQGRVVTAADTDEAGSLIFKTTTSDGTTTVLRSGLSLTGHGTDNKVDVDIGFGSSSMTTIKGDLDIDGDNITTAGAMTVTTAAGGAFTIDAAAAINLDSSATINFQAAGTTYGGFYGSAAQSYLTVSGGSTNAGSVLLYEDTDNGTSYTRLIGAAAMGGNRTITLPDETGTVQLQGPTTGQIINVSLMKDDNYVLYLNTRNYWYSTAGGTYTGNINVSAGDWSSWSDDRQARHCGYIATQACKVNKVRFVGLFSTGYTSGALDFEFALMKWTPGNDTTATVTTTYMTHTDHDGSYTEGSIYNLEFDVSGNNTLAAGDAFTLFARCVDSNASARLQLWYGNCNAEVELT
jgi:hypothetical protein